MILLNFFCTYIEENSFCLGFKFSLLKFEAGTFWVYNRTKGITLKKHFNNLRKLNLIDSKEICQMSKTTIDEIACKMLESLWFNLVNSYCPIGGYISLYEYVA